MTDIIEILTGHSQKSTDEIHGLIKAKFEQNKSIDLITKDGEVIKGVKSIAKWGTGLYYGFVKGQDNFNKSLNVHDLDEATYR